METSLLELCKELSSKSAEIGRLQALLEMKDETIAGLEAMLGMRSMYSKATIPSVSEKFPEVASSSISGEAIINSSKVKTTESAVENLEKTISTISGEPSTKKSEVVEPSTKKSEVVEQSQEGGSVFRDFVPLSLGNVVTQNSHAYLPPDKVSGTLSVIS